MPRRQLILALLLTTVCAGLMLAICATPANDEKGATGTTAPKATAPPSAPPPEPWRSPVSAQDYAFSYWLNGWRKHASDTSKDMLCFETGHYGFALDLADLTTPRFSRYADNPKTYTEALRAGPRAAKEGTTTPLSIEIETDGRIYTATSCMAATQNGPKALANARMWESGQFVQHYDLLGLHFTDKSGAHLPSDASLQIVSWPDSLTLTLEATPAETFRDGPVLGIEGDGLCTIKRPRDFPHAPNLDPENLTVEYWMNTSKLISSEPADGWVLCKNKNEVTDGNYGFLMQHGVPRAVLNIGGGRKNARFIKANDHHVKKDAWNHLALTYDGANMHFYLNGRLQGSEPINKKRKPGTDILRLGQRSDGSGNVASAVFDNLHVWNRALSSNEVRQLAKSNRAPANARGLTFNETFNTKNGNAVKAPTWQNTTIRLKLLDWQTEKTISGAWTNKDKHHLSLQCDIKPRQPIGGGEITVKTSDNQPVLVERNDRLNCQVATVKRLRRKWRGGYTDIRDYDEFQIAVTNTGDQAKEIPFLLDFYNPANITGLCPILCDESGTPTGIPIQLSKNWHEPTLGAYLRCYARLPNKPGVTRYKLRIAYGFYGSLPSASAGQLSLVGYGGGNQRWDQMAVGCWGETICFDMDLSCVDNPITDVRCLMTRNGLSGKKWTWTDAGWGGDWLRIYNERNEPLYFSELKTTYLSHGPCLPTLRYAGSYGQNRDASFQATTQTTRTDDYARTFQSFAYTFNRPLSAENAFLFEMGNRGNTRTPKVFIGNRNGLIKTYDAPKKLENEKSLLDHVKLIGPGPWWVTLPGTPNTSDKGWGTGYRAIIIRSYNATFGGKRFTQPIISTPKFRPRDDGHTNLTIRLVPPSEVTSIQPGDSATFDVEWITLPRIADDYYGPNEFFRKHLAEHPNSWKSTHREAIGNDLKISVTNGEVLKTYPAVIHAKSDTVTVDVQGGVGAVPITFTGLHAPTGYELHQQINGKTSRFDQSVHGNDYWQTTFDPDTNTYSRTYNLPLDGLKTSTWIFKRTPPIP